MIESIRRFNRYYARVLGIFSHKYLEVDYTPTEVRLIGEIGRNPGITAGELAEFLSLDKSYLSREIRKLAVQGIIRRERSDIDGRAVPLFLSDEGTKLNADLDLRADKRIEHQIRKLTDEERGELIRAMQTIQGILSRSISDSIRSK